MIKIIYAANYAFFCIKVVSWYRSLLASCIWLINRHHGVTWLSNHTVAAEIPEEEGHLCGVICWSRFNPTLQNQNKSYFDQKKTTLQYLFLVLGCFWLRTINWGLSNRDARNASTSYSIRLCISAVFEK